MTKTFTKNDVVRFLYEEVNEDERLDIKESLSADMELRSGLAEMSEGKELIDRFSIKAPTDVVSRILYASKHISVSS